jgi:hypothetical protein
MMSDLPDWRSSVPGNQSGHKAGELVLQLLFVLCVCSVSLAQGGGKAEPNRIEFKRGTTSATVTGKIRGDGQAEYVLAARKGQKLTIRLTSVPSRSTVFQLLGPDNDTLGLEHDANYDYSGKLPSNGDYFITVSRPTESRGTSRYKLIVTVR